MSTLDRITVPAQTCVDFNEQIPQELIPQIIAVAELVDSLKFRLVCKEWNDWLPYFLQDACLGFLKGNRLNGYLLLDPNKYAHGKLAEIKILESYLGISYQRNRFYLERCCVDILKTSATRKFHDLVDLNRAVQSTYEVQGTVSLFQRRCLLRDSFEAMHETAIQKTQEALCVAWEKGVYQAVLNADTSGTLQIPNPHARYDEIVALLKSQEAEALLKAVEEIDLSNSGLEFIPNEINYFTHLERLRLHHNQITALPYLQLPHLKLLDVSYNQVTRLPSHLNLPNLQSLLLDYNHITEVSPSVNLPELKKLLLNCNQITKWPQEILLPNLTALRLNYNQITELPPSMDLPQLEHLSLCGNELTDILSELKLPNLIFLDIRENEIWKYPYLPLCPQLSQVRIFSFKSIDMAVHLFQDLWDRDPSNDGLGL